MIMIYDSPKEVGQKYTRRTWMGNKAEKIDKEISKSSKKGKIPSDMFVKKDQNNTAEVLQCNLKR